jgi:DNA-binding phage protein
VAIAILADVLAAVIRQAAMSAVVMASLKAAEVTSDTFHLAQLNRRLEVSDHLVHLAAKRVYACRGIRKTLRVDGNPCLNSLCSDFSELVKVIAKAGNPAVLGYISPLGKRDPPTL